MRENERLGTERVGKLLWQLALPSITAQLVNMLYNIVDRIYIGHIQDVGPLALTGVGLCFPIIIFITAFSNLIGAGGAPQVSMKLGRQEREGAEETLGNCFTALLVLAVLLTAAFLLWGEELLFLFGASENTVGYALEYLNIYVLGTVFVMIALGMNPFITAQGFSRVSMMTTLLGAVVKLLDLSAWAIRIYLAGGLMLGVQFSCQQTFIALGEAKISLFLALLRKIFLLIPLIYILPSFFEDKVFGVFLAEPVADVLAAMTTGTLFWLRFRTLIGASQKS